MNLLYTHWHEKSLFTQYPTQKENPSGIKVSYVLENDQEFERTQALITPLSTFYIPGEADQEITDEQHARHLITLKMVDYCHRIVYEWFDLIKKTKKEIIVHLFEISPYERSNFYESIHSLQDPLHLFLKTSLVNALIKEAEQRVYIPDHWHLAPKEGLLLGLDFKMIPIRVFQSEKERPISMDLVGHLINFRTAGLSRLLHLEKGVGIEGNHRLVHKELGGHYKDLLDFFTNHYNGQFPLRLIIHRNSILYKSLGPKMMLHAIGVFIQKHKLRKAEKIWRELNSSRSFYDGLENKKLAKLFSIGRKIEVENWFNYLMEPAFNDPPLLSKKMVKDLHQIVLRRTGEPNFWKKHQRMISLQAEETFQLKKSTSRSTISLDAIQLIPTLSIKDRMTIFLEQYS